MATPRECPLLHSYRLASFHKLRRHRHDQDRSCSQGLPHRSGLHQQYEPLHSLHQRPMVAPRASCCWTVSPSYLHGTSLWLYRPFCRQWDFFRRLDGRSRGSSRARGGSGGLRCRRRCWLRRRLWIGDSPTVIYKQRGSVQGSNQQTKRARHRENLRKRRSKASTGYEGSPCALALYDENPKEWGHRGSNPGPADYESAALTD